MGPEVWQQGSDGSINRHRGTQSHRGLPPVPHCQISGPMKNSLGWMTWPSALDCAGAQGQIVSGFSAWGWTGAWGCSMNGSSMWDWAGIWICSTPSMKGCTHALTLHWIRPEDCPCTQDPAHGPTLSHSLAYRIRYMEHHWYELLGPYRDLVFYRVIGPGKDACNVWLQLIFTY